METKKGIGVIVGRFQVHELHSEHKKLIQTVLDNHKKVLIFLGIIGISPVPVTKDNPLDYESRKQMIQSEFPEVNILFIKDHKSDYIWSKNLDDNILTLIGPNKDVTLYGSRDSFIPYYKGQFTTKELNPEKIISGSEIRNSLSEDVKNSKEWRAGVIWAAQNQFPRVNVTTDVAIMNKELDMILLGKKVTDSGWRFIGGFANVNKTHFEKDACREVKEETGLEIILDSLQYICSAHIEDWRFSGNSDQCIKTIFYLGYVEDGAQAKAADDLDGGEVQWFNIKDVEANMFVPNHIYLWHNLNDFLNNLEKEGSKNV